MLDYPVLLNTPAAAAPAAYREADTKKHFWGNACVCVVCVCVCVCVLVVCVCVCWCWLCVCVCVCVYTTLDCSWYSIVGSTLYYSILLCIAGSALL